jgi:uncharacterized protein YdeI (YjbR/CyaY-like superfamily)
MNEPVFFKSAAEWRGWLEANHATAQSITLGLVKVGSGLEGVTHKAALDEALCFGWIDGVGRSIDERRWTIRFSPRRRRSIWSAVNIKRVGELIAEGRMAEPGLRVFENRDRSKERSYSFENPDAALAPAEEERLRANEAAWRFFSGAPPSYRHPAVWWVVSAKKPETRERRLAMLIEDSAAGRRVKHLRRPGGSGASR